jgi:hypothetical protein
VLSQVTGKIAAFSVAGGDIGPISLFDFFEVDQIALPDERDSD